LLQLPAASGTISLTSDFASPPAIGSTTPNSAAFTTLTANNGTLTASAPVLDLAQTWNNAAVTFTGLRVNVTNTASGSSSLLADFQVGGTSVLKIGPDGALQARTTQAVHVRIGSGFDGLGINGGLPCLRHGGIVTFRASSSGNYMNNVPLGWSSSLNGTSNVILVPEADATLAQRNTTNPQTFRIYTTYGGTGGADFERLFIKGQTLGAFQIGTEKGGTGSARALEFQTDGTTRVTILSTGQMGIGTTNPNRSLHISDAAAMGRIDRIGGNGPAFLMTRMAVLGTVTSSWLFGPATGFASVANDDFSIIDFGTAVGGVSGTQRLTIAKSDGQLTVNGNLNLATKDLVTDTTTGTKIGTATTQKIGFFGATPVVQQAAVADATDAATAITQLNDLLAAMRTLGLIAT
jgi:hypothetical protein